MNLQTLGDESALPYQSAQKVGAAAEVVFIIDDCCAESVNVALVLVNGQQDAGNDFVVRHYAVEKMYLKFKKNETT